MISALQQSEGNGIIPWSPHARGRLASPWQTESTKRFETDQFGKIMYSKTEDVDRAVVDRVGKISEKRGVSRAQVALAWMLGKPAITSPIVGATKPHHLSDAAAAVSLRLTPEEVSSLEELLHAASGAGLQIVTSKGCEFEMVSDRSDFFQKRDHYPTFFRNFWLRLIRVYNWTVPYEEDAMRIYPFTLAAVVALSFATPSRAAEKPRPAQGSQNQSKKVWTNDDMEQLSSRGLISIVGPEVTEAAAPVTVTPSEPTFPVYNSRLEDPEWYAAQKAADLQTELDRREAALQQEQAALAQASDRVTQPGVAMDQPTIGVTPGAALALLQAQVEEVQSQLDELSDLARQNNFPQAFCAVKSWLFRIRNIRDIFNATAGRFINRRFLHRKYHLNAVCALGAGSI